MYRDSTDNRYERRSRDEPEHPYPGVRKRPYQQGQPVCTRCGGNPSYAAHISPNCPVEFKSLPQQKQFWMQQNGLASIPSPLPTPPPPATSAPQPQPLPEQFAPLFALAEKLKRSDEERETKKKKKEKEAKKQAEMAALKKQIRAEAEAQFQKNLNELKTASSSIPSPPIEMKNGYDVVFAALRKEYSAGKTSGKWPNGAHSMLRARAIQEGVLSAKAVERCKSMSSLVDLYCAARSQNVGSLSLPSLVYLLRLSMLRLAMMHFNKDDIDWTRVRTLLLTNTLICARLVQFDFSKFSVFRNFFPNTPLSMADFNTARSQVYLICSPLFPNLWYLGSTIRTLFTRFREHCTNALYNSWEMGSTLYRKLSYHSPLCFIIVPISLPPPTHLRSLEAHLIRIYNPSLNSAPRTFPAPYRARSFNLLNRANVTATPSLCPKAYFEPVRRSTNTEATALTFFSSVKYTSTNPYLVISHHRHNTIVRLAISPGAFRLFNSHGRVARDYNQSLIIHPRHLFGCYMRDMLAGGIPSEVAIVVRKRRAIPVGVSVFLEHIARRGWRSFILFNLPLASLLYLLICCKHLPSQQISQLALSSIKTVLYKNFTLRSLPSLILRVPFSPYWRRSLLKNVLCFLLDFASLPVIIMHKILAASRIVQTSRKSLGRIFFSHIAFFQKFPPNPVCCCSSSPHSYRLPTDLPASFRCILSKHTGFVPPPSNLNHLRDICTALSLVAQKVRLFSCNKMTPPISSSPYITLNSLSNSCTIHVENNFLSIPTPRLLFMYRCFSHAAGIKKMHDSADAQFQHIKAFTHKLVNLCGEFARSRRNPSSCILLPDLFIDIFTETDVHLYFTSSLTCTLNLPPRFSYSSVLSTDLCFGSAGSPLQGAWSRPGIIPPLDCINDTIYAILWALFSVRSTSRNLHIFSFVLASSDPLLLEILSHPQVTRLSSLPAGSLLLKRSPFTSVTGANQMPIYIYCISNYSFSLPMTLVKKICAFLPTVPLIRVCPSLQVDNDFFWSNIVDKYPSRPCLTKFLSAWGHIYKVISPQGQVIPAVNCSNLVAVLMLQHNLHILGFRSFDLLPNLIGRTFYPGHYASEFYSSQINRCKDAVQGWVISPMDKNNNKFILQCPCLVRDNTLSVFIHNRVNYKLVSSDVDNTRSTSLSLLSSWHRIYHEHGWDRLHPWPSSFRFPNGYLLPKWKDIALGLKVFRNRPIVNCSLHPCRKIFHCTGKAILLALQRVNCQHFSLWKCQDAKTWISSLAEPTSLPFGLDTRFLFGPGDIANCFDKLSHVYILDSLSWLFTTLYAQVRAFKGRFHVNHLTDAAHFGRAFDAMSSCEFSTDDAWNVVFFALKNCFFTVGVYLLKQFLGSPMGGQLSSALAQLVCIRGEHLTMSSLGLDSRFIAAKRYVDDVALILFYKENDQKSLERAHGLLTRVHKCYHESLVVKAGDVKNNAFTFLESIISSSGSQLTISYFNKNQASIFEVPPRQTISRYIPFSSFSPDHIKLNSIPSALRRIHQNCASNSSFLPHAICILAELAIFGEYPKSFIISQLTSLASGNSGLPELNSIIFSFRNLSPVTMLSLHKANHFLNLNLTLL